MSVRFNKAGQLTTKPFNAARAPSALTFNASKFCAAYTPSSRAVVGAGVAGVSDVGVVTVGVCVDTLVCGGTDGLGGMVPAQADKASAAALTKPIFKLIVLLVRVMPEVTLFKNTR